MRGVSITNHTITKEAIPHHEVLILVAVEETMEISFLGYETIGDHTEFALQVKGLLDSMN